MSLNYVTRGDASPQGKPRIYFTGHPIDYLRFFKSISQEVLQQQNCAVYYDQEPETEYDSNMLISDLSQMQLFLIPVTTEFLTKPSKARDIEFPFAINSHIPVLPLLQENGLEELFNKICGDLQMLNPNDQDPTAIPYKEKLTKYLNEVLIGDKLAEKIRKSFDAYIFLSYRKKDRRHAQELIRLIHKNAFCRDIAIWYDEFLMPGDNFNKLIEQALQKGDLFTLVITPNMINETNYVETTEYPMAQAAGKPILPVEVVPTDHLALQERFDGIPPCTDAYDENALSNALLEKLHGISFRQNDSDPPHNFFIGLAYLNGIDVEVDRGRAVELITNAAEDGLPEAIEKLVSMYRNGDGVERDYYKAIQWQKKAVSIWEKKYNKCQSNYKRYTYGSKLFGSLESLGDFYYELRDLLSAKKIFAQMEQIGKEFVHNYNTIEAISDLAISYGRLGNVAREEGDLSQAKKYFLQDLELCKQMEGETEFREEDRGVAIVLDRLSDIYLSEGDLSQAKEYRVQAHNVSKRLLEKTQTIENKQGLAVSLLKLGDISKNERNLFDAEERYLEALELYKQLTEENQSVIDKRGLSICYYKLGDICHAKGQMAQAKDYYLYHLELSKQLAGEMQTVESKMYYLLSYNRLSLNAKEEGDLLQASKYALRCIECSEQLAEDIHTAQVKGLLAISYCNYGDVLFEAGKFSLANDYFTKCMHISLQLVDETQDIAARRDLAAVYLRLGSVFRAENNLSQAKGFIAVSAVQRKSLVDEFSLKEDRESLALTYDNLGETCNAGGELEFAKRCFLDALKLRLELAEESPTLQARSDLADSYSNVAVICMAEDNKAQAKEYLDKSLGLRKVLVDESTTIQSRDNLASSYLNLSTLYENSDKKKSSYLKCALDIWTELSQQCPNISVFEQRRSKAYALFEFITVSAQSSPPKAFEKIVNMYRSADGVKKDIKSAIGWQKEYVIYLEKIWEESGSEESYLAVINGYTKLGELLQSVRKEDVGPTYILSKIDYNAVLEAKSVFMKVIELCESLVDSRVTVENLSVLAEAYSHPAILLFECIESKNTEYILGTEGVRDCIELFRKCINTWKRIDTSDISIHENVQRMYRMLIKICRKSGDKGYLKLSIELYEECVAYVASSMGTDLHQNIEFLTYSKDGSALIIGFKNGIVKIWSFDQSKIIRTICEFNEAIKTACFSDDSSYILLASPVFAKLYKWPAMECVSSIFVDGDYIRNAQFSKDGNNIALLVGKWGSGHSNRHYVFIYGLSNFEQVFAAEGYRISNNVVFSSDLKFLMIHRYKSIEIYDVQTQNKIGVIKLPGTHFVSEIPSAFELMEYSSEIETLIRSTLSGYRVKVRDYFDEKTNEINTVLIGDGQNNIGNASTSDVSAARALHPTKHILAISDGSKVDIWDLEQFIRVDRLEW